MHLELLYQSAEVSALGCVRIIAGIAGGRGVEPKGALRTMDAYGLTLILEGTGEYHGGSAYHYDLVPGSLILTYPNRPHTFGTPKGQTWTEMFAIFDGPIFDLLLEKHVLSDDRRVLQLQDSDHWARRLREIAEVSQPVEVQAGLAAWLIQAVESSAPSSQMGESFSWITRATTILESDLSEPISMESVAQRLGIGYETFRKEFARATGLSPMKFRTGRRMTLANHLLRHTGLPISEIAGRLGYPDAFTFSKAFKRQYRHSPTHHRSAVTLSHQAIE